MVSPPVQGGVRTILLKLCGGLAEDNYDVEIVPIDGNLLTLVCKDASNVKYLSGFDIVIYIGSIAWPSHLLVSGPTKALFLHGFVKQELVNAIREQRIRTRLSAMLSLFYWELFNAHLSRLDFLICHSQTAFEINSVDKDCAILPQFVLPTEISAYASVKKTLSGKRRSNTSEEVVILSYTSLANSPRLLRTKHLRWLHMKVRRMTKKNVRFCLIGPGASTSVGSGFEVSNFLPRNEFLSLLARTDLYLERCVDEELGLGSLEAGLLGVPVAKVTLSPYASRQDYTEKEILVADSLSDLATNIAEYVDHVDHYRPYYNGNLMQFVKTKRTWDRIKHPLLRFLKRG